MKVKFYAKAPGSYANIIWPGRHPMRGGVFPMTHPAAPGGGWTTGTQAGASTGLVAFRERGYWASCFPEGDGITLDYAAGKPAADVVRDIEECFGWSVVVERGDQPDPTNRNGGGESV